MFWPAVILQEEAAIAPPAARFANDLHEHCMHLLIVRLEPRNRPKVDPCSGGSRVEPRTLDIEHVTNVNDTAAMVASRPMSTLLFGSTVL